MNDSFDEKKNRIALFNFFSSIFIIIFFLGIVILYYSMLSSETKEHIIDDGQINAMNSAQQIDRYLTTSKDILKLTAFTLDNMLREGRNNSEILDYMRNQTIAVEESLIEDTTGIYGYINGEYLDGSGWEPDEDYVPTERPWYIQAVEGKGDIIIVNPYMDMDTGTFIIGIAKLLEDGESVVSIDISLGILQDITEEHASGNPYYTEMVICEDGHIIAHSDRNRLPVEFGENPDGFEKAVIDMVKTSDENWLTLDYNDDRYVIYTMPLENGWTCISVTDATKDYLRLTIPLFITIASSVFILAVLVFFIINSEKKNREVRRYAFKSERARKESEAKSAFLSTMSHEIRTPITAMLGMNEMIHRESNDATILKYSDNITSAGRTLLTLINDILDLSKIEAGKMEIIPVEYYSESLVKDMVNLIQPRAEEKKIKIITEFDASMPGKLKGDEIRIKQIIANLLTNAVKYTHEGSIHFKIGYKKIDKDPGSIYLIVSVKDTGIGIKAENMEKLFNRYERIEEERNRSVEGTGLGLNITGKLLQMMGSSLTAESTYGEGSVFGFSLKQEVVDSTPVSELETEEEDESKTKTRFIAPSARVLVIDDTPMNIEVFKSLLKRTRVKIDSEYGGNEGIAATKNVKYDIIFIDHMMPGKNGVEVMKEIKADTDNQNHDTVMICLTANAISGAREEYIKEGFDDYMSKPIDPAALDKMLLHYLPNSKVMMIMQTEDDEDKGLALPDFIRDISEIDTEQGLYNCGSVEAYLETLKNYADIIGDYKEEIDSYAADDNFDYAVIRIHGLKSTSRVIGAMELGDLAQKVENAGKAKDKEAFLSGWKDLSDRCTRLAKALDKLKLENDVDDSEKTPVSEGELGAILKAIKGNLLDWELDKALELVEKLKKYRIPSGSRENVNALIKAAEDFDYRKMSEILG